MIIVGELINGMYKEVGKAIQEKDKKAIQELARKQAQAKADMLDVNVGPTAKDAAGAMQWLVETIQEVCELPLVLDSTKPQAIEAGLKLLKKPGVINSTSADQEKLDILLPLAKNYQAKIIGLTMDKKGIPRDRNQRTELALKIVSACMEASIDTQDIFIDPIVLPVNVAQPQAQEVLEAIREFKLLAEPPVKSIVGLSNVSQGAQERSLINRTFLVMALAFGLSAAILDPLDKELAQAAITAELILNKSIYCDSFLEARSKA